MQHKENSQDEKLRMRSHLIVFALALLFMLVAGSIALYRYMRQHQAPQAQAAWEAQPLDGSHNNRQA